MQPAERNYLEVDYQMLLLLQITIQGWLSKV